MRRTVWKARRMVSTRKMMTAILRKFWPRVMVDDLVPVSCSMEPVILSATAAESAMRKSVRLRVMREMMPVGVGASVRRSLFGSERSAEDRKWSRDVPIKD